MGQLFLNTVEYELVRPSYYSIKSGQPGRSIQLIYPKQDFERKKVYPYGWCNC
jgi:hypothetical protein